MVIRVVVCDDQAVVREGLELILNSDKEIKVVGLAADGHEAIELVAKHKPELVLMDLNMPVMNGVLATEKIRRDHPDVRVLVLTTFGEDAWVFDAIRGGAAGYLLKGTPRQEIIAAVKGTVAGKSYIDPEVGGKLLKQVAGHSGGEATTFKTNLSEREMEVLKLVAKGLSNAEISGRLHITRGTVRNYVSAVLSKLGVEDRTQAALLASKHGLAD
jgi:NarL family two-component system response regulator LiaR